MQRVGYFKAFVLAALLVIAWVVVVLFATLNGWGRAPLAPSGDTAAFAEAAKRKLASEHRGNAVFVLVENGAPAADHALSIGDPVDLDTLFQVASLSKWITAWGVMALVEDGKLDLDTPVSTYLTRWQLPASEFDNGGVTVRRLLSHTAGLTDGLGYGGFAPGHPVQSLEDSLTQAADASPNADGRARVGLPPGSEWRYSGGGYTLLQLLIEEVTGESFARYMARTVFAPLGMSRSTFFVEPDTANVATFHDVDGTVATHYRFTALAAASLYTSARDMTRFIAAHLRGPSGELPGRGVLSPATLERMREPLGFQFGIEIWGLGTMLYAPNGDGDFIIGHDGSNEPAINTAVRLDPTSGDGIVVLETGNRLLATELAGDWVFWQTGTLDFLAFSIAMAPMMRIAIGGAIAILLAIAGFSWWRRRAGR